MRLPAFLVGLALLMIAVVVWGILTGAGLGKIVLMMLVAALVAQGFYLLLIMVMTRDQAKTREPLSKTTPTERIIQRDTPDRSSTAHKPESQA